MENKNNNEKKEVKKTAKKVKEELKGAVDKVGKEAKKISDEAKKDAGKVEKKAEKTEKKVEKEIKKDEKKLEKEIKQTVDKLKEEAEEFKEEAKSTADEFTTGAKEAYDELTSNKENKKILAGILAIVLGAFGVHKFILGYNKEGIIMLVATVILGLITCGIGAWLVGIVGLVEGIIYLTKSDEEFYQTYQVHKKPWF